MSLRVIARLDVKPPFVVKPVHFDGLRKMGTPEEMAMKYYEQGADEIFYIDIVASLYRRKILIDHIRDTARPLMVPFAAGGGIRSLDDFTLLMKNGVDKAIINTYALQENPSIIEEAARVFGSQAIVVHVEAKKWKDRWECYSDCGRIQSNKNVMDWVMEAESLGAGEIMVSSVDMDGRQRGFDIDLIKQVISKVKVPVIAASGAGSLEDIATMVGEANPDAVAVASLLHYDKFTISDIKRYLLDRGVEVEL